METDSKIVLVFVAFAVAVGSISGIFEVETLWGAEWGFAIALLFFYVSYRIAPRVLDLEESSFDTSAWNVMKKGAIPYWFLWLVSWTLIYTLKFP